MRCDDTVLILTPRDGTMELQRIPKNRNIRDILLKYMSNVNGMVKQVHHHKSESNMLTKTSTFNPRNQNLENTVSVS